MRLLGILSAILNKLKYNQHIRLLKILWPFLWSTDKNLRMRFLGTFFIIIFSTGLNVIVPLLFKQAIEVLSVPELRKESLIFLVVGFYGLIWTFTRVSINLREVLMFRVMEKGVARLSAYIFEHIHSLSYDFHAKRKTGEITSAIEKAQLAFPTILWPFFFLIIPTLLEVLSVSALLSYLYGWLYGFIMITTISFFLIYSIRVLKWSLEALRQSNEKHYECNSNIVDTLINFSTVRLFNNQAVEFNKCKAMLQTREEAMVKTLMRGRLVTLGQDIIIGIALIFFSLLTSYNVLYGSYSASDFVLINSYVLQFSLPLGSLGFILKTFIEQLTHKEKIIDLLNQRSDTKDGKDTLQIIDRQIAVSCKNVYFGYKERKPILKGISFDLLPGKTLAIVGPTGSGKSTITHLLLRSYTCKSGEILINGKNINHLKQETFLKHVGVVPQDITLFNDTLKNNLTYGNPNVSEDFLSEIINLSLLNFLIDSLPQGLATIVGERGLALSTGEKQKVGIARVLLKQPYFYIFDEATSSLDTKTEEIIMQNIRKKTQNATVLIIAHRLSTVRGADKILVFQKGEIVEAGTHSELLKKNGSYASLYSAQASISSSIYNEG